MYIYSSAPTTFIYFYVINLASNFACLVNSSCQFESTNLGEKNLLHSLVS